jgi:hypothetical protein
MKFTMISLAMGVVVAAGVLACNGESSGGATGPEQDIKTMASFDSTHDPKLVGQWTTNGNDLLLFHSLSLHKDGTFNAVGGCAPTAAGAPVHCFAIVEIHGLWKSGVNGTHTQLTLTDQSAQATNLFYTVTGDTIELGKDVAGAKSVFKKEPDARIGANKACNEGDVCVDGFECRSNCPINAECVVQFNVCQPKQMTIKQGGVCGPTEDLKPGTNCAPGLTCKSNCPEGAKCIVEIDTCQPQ